MKRINSGVWAIAIAVMLSPSVRSQQFDPEVLKAQSARVAAVNKVSPAVVAIFARGGAGGGSGVLISDDGYALSNYHVTSGAGNTMQCGLADGVLYDAVLVGHDKVGDVALVKLLPKKAGDKFPFAVMGDSDIVREGDWAMAMGNPFLLATDFAPTVTFGLVSGVHRYQYPAGTFLEYTDCIQIDTSINPGNSGGPLFNLKGELIGINGRGSFDKRGRVNSGVGYAISINQIKNFMGHLKGGLDCDHASLGALIQTADNASGGIGRMLVTSILEDSDVFRRGLDLDDELVAFAGRSMGSVNQYKNVLGLYPRGWRVPLEFRRDQQRKEVLVRLMGVQRREIGGGDPNDQPKKPGIIKAPPKPSPADKYFEEKSGYANFYFNKQETKRVSAAFKKHGDFGKLTGAWKLDGQVRLKKLTTPSPFRVEITDEKVADSKTLKPTVKLTIGSFPYIVEPLPTKEHDPKDLKQPLGTGGLAAALFVYHRLLTVGDQGFGTDFNYGGFEPMYPPPADGNMPRSLADLRVDAEVINSRIGPYLTKWFFARDDQKLLGFEVRLEENEDPCEVFLSDYRNVDGRLLPHRMSVVYGDTVYGTFTIERYDLAAN